jgi:hypothetical protein
MEKGGAIDLYQRFKVYFFVILSGLSLNLKRIFERFLNRRIITIVRKTDSIEANMYASDWLKTCCNSPTYKLST